jgi:hypothetical protein
MKISNAQFRLINRSDDKSGFSKTVLIIHKTTLTAINWLNKAGQVSIECQNQSKSP